MRSISACIDLGSTGFLTLEDVEEAIFAKEEVRNGVDLDNVARAQNKESLRDDKSSREDEKLAEKVALAQLIL